MKREFRIVNYVNGKYGYKQFFELQEWNPIYERYATYKQALRLQFIYDYCLISSTMKGIDYKNIPIVKL